MEADCRIPALEMLQGEREPEANTDFPYFPPNSLKRRRKIFRRNFSLVYSLLIVLLLYEVRPARGLYVKCDTVPNCICGKAENDGWRIECPNETRFNYPIELTVQKLDTSNLYEASLSIRCGENEENPWSYIKGMDLSASHVDGKVVRLEIKFCPPVNDGWSDLLKELNLTGSDIRRFSFIREDRNISGGEVQIPPNFFKNMPNIEILNLRDNMLNTLPDFSNLKKLQILNLRNNKLRVLTNKFNQNSQLTNIALTNNNIVEISPRTFPDSVEHLELNKNLISYLNSSIFENLTRLKRLYLDGNPLDNINPDTFDGMPALEELLIYNSKMTQFPNLHDLKKLVNFTISTAIYYKTKTSDSSGDITTTLAPDYLPENTLILQNLPSLENVRLALNHFKTLPVFQNLPKLVSIDLRRNELTEIESGAFANLPSLKTLILTQNKLKKIGTIKAPTLVELDVSRNSLTEVQNDTFISLNSLRKLNMSKNQINFIAFKAFEPLSSLEEIDLSYNQITFSSSPYAGASVSDNFGGFFGDVSNQSPLRWSFKLRKLYLSHNEIPKLGYTDWSQVFTQVNEIDLSFNKIQRVIANELNFISSNVTLNLENNLISAVDLTWKFVLEDSSNSGQREERIYLAGNPLKCDCLAYLLKTFTSDSFKLRINNINCASPPELSGRKLVEVPNENLVCDIGKGMGCPEPCTCRERTADTTVLVDCSSLNLTSDDLPNLNTFKGNYAKWMVELDLSNNEITDFSNTSYINEFLNKTTYINLSQNKLTTTLFLEKIPEYKPTKFALGKNPFPCGSCVGFQIPWRAFPTRISDLGNVTCQKDRETSYFSSDSGEDYDLLYVQENSKEFEKFCASPKFPLVLIVSLVVAVAFLLCLCICLFATIRYGWAIKAYLYSKGWYWCLFWERDLDADEDDPNEKLYDAFVSYSHKDEEWVLDELVNKLETQDGFKLCLHFRDWTPGDWIPDQIIRSVDKSRRTIVVLSKNFVESVWSRLEFKAAHAQALKERSNRVILILLGEDLKECDVNDDDLKMYMQMNTFMKWNDPLFWHRLKYALPHRKPVTPSSQQEDQERKQNVIDRMQQHERAIKLDKIRAKWEQNV